MSPYYYNYNGRGPPPPNVPNRYDEPHYQYNRGRGPIRGNGGGRPSSPNQSYGPYSTLRSPLHSPMPPSGRHQHEPAILGSRVLEPKSTRDIQGASLEQSPKRKRPTAPAKGVNEVHKKWEVQTETHIGVVVRVRPMTVKEIKDAAKVRSK